MRDILKINSLLSLNNNDSFKEDLTMHRSIPPFRADHVGSLLRPAELLEARDKFSRGEMSPDVLREVEDKSIREVVKLQEDIGLESITDGEYRRFIFHIDFLK